MKLSTILTLSVTMVALALLVVFLIITDRDPALFLTALPIIVIQVTALFRQEKVVRQTNGTLSARDARIAQLESALHVNGITAPPSSVPGDVASTTRRAEPPVAGSVVDGVFYGTPDQ